MSEEATIKLKRRWNLVGCFGKFTLFIDDKKLGAIGNGETELFKVAPGAHSIYIKGVFWSKTKVIEIQALPNKTMAFECGIAKSYLVLLACLIVLLIAGNNLIKSSDPQAIAIGLAIACLIIIIGIVGTIYTFKPNSVYDLKEIKEDTIVN